jgi:hypothetical protein
VLDHVGHRVRHTFARHVRTISASSSFPTVRRSRASACHPSERDGPAGSTSAWRGTQTCEQDVAVNVSEFDHACVLLSREWSRVRVSNSPSRRTYRRSHHNAPVKLLPSKIAANRRPRRIQIFAGVVDDCSAQSPERNSRVLISGRASLVERRDRLQRHWSCNLAIRVPAAVRPAQKDRPAGVAPHAAILHARLATD